MNASDTGRAVLDAIADGVLVISPTGRVLFANPAAESMFGRGSLVGEDLGVPIARGDMCEVEVRVPPDQFLVAELRTSTTSWEGGPAQICILRDSTGRRIVEDELRQAASARDELASILAHELRTPLAAISGFANLLLTDGRHLTPQESEQVLQRLLANADRMRRLVTNLLDLRRTEIGLVQPAQAAVPVAASVEHVLSMLEVDEIAIDIDPDIEVWADPDHVEQILINLIDNAGRYGRPPIELTTGIEEDSVSIVVSDHGDGVPAELRTSLFDPYVRGPQAATLASNGAGLGLAVVRNLATANGGSAAYEPVRGEGAVRGRFVVRLPAVDDASIEDRERTG